MSWTDQKKYPQSDLLLGNVDCDIAGDKAYVEIDQVWYDDDDGNEVTKYRLTMGTLFGSQSVLFDDLRGLLVTWNALTKARKKDLPVDIKAIAKLEAHCEVIVEEREKKEKTKA